MGRRSLLCAAASTAGPVRSTWRMLGQTIKVSPTSILSSPECDWPGAYRSASTSMKLRQASLLQRGSPPLLRSNIAPGLNRSLLTIYVSTQFAHCFGSFNSASDANYRYWRILPVAPAATFSPFPPVRTAHREHVLRVELTHSPRSLERPLLAQSSVRRIRVWGHGQGCQPQSESRSSRKAESCSRITVVTEQIDGLSVEPLFSMADNSAPPMT
jgi:hypothetical protein